MKKTITITILVILAATIGMVLAANKAKINKAAEPVKNQAVIPVKVHKVKEEGFLSSFSYAGTTAPFKEVKIASEVQGKITGLFIKNGDVVSAGEVIASLDASVYNAQLARTNASIEKARMDISRYTKLIEMGGSTPMQLESAQQQLNGFIADRKQVLQQIEHMQIRAPFSGRVENVLVETGSFVSFGTVLAELINNSSLKINLYLTEKEAFNLKPGQAVSIASQVITEPVPGVVRMISDKADASGKFLTEITIKNTVGQKLKAGMLTDVSFNTEMETMRLSVPVSAITGSTKQARVFVVSGNKVTERNIQTGVVLPDKVEVISGLAAGELIVISGHINLENGSAISINK